MRQTNLRDSYSFYVEETIDNAIASGKITTIQELEFMIDCKTYLKIVYGFIQFLIQKVLDGYDVRLGANLGILAIRGKKLKPIIDKEGEIKGVAPNWAKTKGHWKEAAKAMELTFEEYIAKVDKKDRQLVYCFNEHSDGITYNIRWNKATVAFKNKTMYSFVPRKGEGGWKRDMSKLIKNGKEYLVTD